MEDRPLPGGPRTPAAAPVPGKQEAQARVERVHAFRRQLDELLREGILELGEEQRRRVDTYLNDLLADLAARFDVDVTESQKRFSLGMRVAATLGGVALCMSLVFFFYRIWGDLTVPVQVTVLMLAPLAALAALELVGRREKARYFTGLLGLLVLAAFILNLSALGTIFNVMSTPNALLVWGAVAVVLAYGYRLRLPLAAGLAMLVVYVGATLMSWSGGYWEEFMSRPEGLALGGLLATAVPAVLRHRESPEFPPLYRLVGLTFPLLAMLIMMHEEGMSYLPWAPASVSVFYQVLAFVSATAVVWTGVSRGLPDLVNLGSLAFAIYLFDRFFTWWWDWMPKYLLFLIIGIVALALLAVFRRLRAGTSRGIS